MPKVFISHTAADKPIVEPIALELLKIFGKEEVFYDAWAIKPGDGIIEKMNEGLDAPEFFFFFVSDKSKDSPMVKLEWQNALMQATKGQTRIIPIRVDGCDMPPILLQNLYIDLHSQGMEATVHQIANLVQGNDGFTSEHGKFSNLTCSITGDPTSELDIVISASHLLEVIPKILFCMGKSEDEFNITGSSIEMAGFI
ncbi:MAG: toll/interleukin-1 receptor domain-containing protein [Paracoccaceae bacterium]